MTLISNNSLCVTWVQKNIVTVNVSHLVKDFYVRTHTSISKTTYIQVYVYLFYYDAQMTPGLSNQYKC